MVEQVTMKHQRIGDMLKAPEKKTKVKAKKDKAPQGEKVDLSKLPCFFTMYCYEDMSARLGIIKDVHASLKKVGLNHLQMKPCPTNIVMVGEFFNSLKIDNKPSSDCTLRF